MSPGEVLDEETVITIAQVDPLRVDVILPSYLFGSVRPGDSVEVVPEPPLDEPRIAEVDIVDRVLDGASGTFGVQLVLPNPDHDLPGGLRCMARLVPNRGDLEAENQPADPEQKSPDASSTTTSVSAPTVPAEGGPRRRPYSDAGPKDS
jgi:multidrug efflux pump subunit AcrA (membrane-fusion protein)